MTRSPLLISHRTLAALASVTAFALISAGSSGTVLVGSDAGVVIDDAGEDDDGGEVSVSTDAGDTTPEDTPCHEDPPFNDKDCDGVLYTEDCDDLDAESLTKSEDADCDGLIDAEDCAPENAALPAGIDVDCDGVSVEDDCDDEDPELGAVSQDHDCDGTLYANDCDDFDETVGDISVDADCDGAPADVDCDDHAAAVGSSALDADCDGFLDEEDCSPQDDTLPADNDQDCDGTSELDDCDDFDASSTHKGEDADCDGVLTDDDCDDTSFFVGARALDADCDGYVDAEDCAPADPTLPAATDWDCDGVPSYLDCDDNDAESATKAEDGDCDGVLTADDCNDANPEVGHLEVDADCDGVEASVDCDDHDQGVGDIALDADCDGSPTSTDCDDETAALGDISLDADCDGAPSSTDCDDGDPAISTEPTDLDCDGYANDVEATCGSSGFDADSIPADLDNDEVCNALDDDADGDGHDRSSDCDDKNADVFPGAIEIDWNGVDDNCDGDFGSDFVAREDLVLLGEPTLAVADGENLFVAFGNVVVAFGKDVAGDENGDNDLSEMDAGLPDAGDDEPSVDGGDADGGSASVDGGVPSLDPPAEPSGQDFGRPVLARLTFPADVQQLVPAGEYLHVALANLELHSVHLDDGYRTNSVLLHNSWGQPQSWGWASHTALVRDVDDNALFRVNQLTVSRLPLADSGAIIGAVPFFTSTDGWLTGVALTDEHVVVYANDGLKFIDKASETLVATVPTDHGGSDIWALGDYVYTADYLGLSIVTLDADIPQQIATQADVDDAMVLVKEAGVFACSAASVVELWQPDSSGALVPLGEVQAAADGLSTLAGELIGWGDNAVWRIEVGEIDFDELVQPTKLIDQLYSRRHAVISHDELTTFVGGYIGDPSYQRFALSDIQSGNLNPRFVEDSTHASLIGGRLVVDGEHVYGADSFTGLRSVQLDEDHAVTAHAGQVPSGSTRRGITTAAGGGYVFLLSSWPFDDEAFVLAYQVGETDGPLEFVGSLAVPVDSEAIAATTTHLIVLPASSTHEAWAFELTDDTFAPGSSTEPDVIVMPLAADDIVAVESTLFYIGDEGLGISDVAQPSAPTHHGSLGSVVGQLAVSGERVVVAADDSVVVVDVTDLDVPVVIATQGIAPPRSVPPTLGHGWTAIPLDGGNLQLMQLP